MVTLAVIVYINTDSGSIAVVGIGLTVASADGDPYIYADFWLWLTHSPGVAVARILGAVLAGLTIPIVPTLAGSKDKVA